MTDEVRANLEMLVPILKITKSGRNIKYLDQWLEDYSTPELAIAAKKDRVVFQTKGTGAGKHLVDKRKFEVMAKWLAGAMAWPLPEIADVKVRTELYPSTDLKTAIFKMSQHTARDTSYNYIEKRFPEFTQSIDSYVRYYITGECNNKPQDPFILALKEYKRAFKNRWLGSVLDNKALEDALNNERNRREILNLELAAFWKENRP